jgi:hypothetical protein
MFSPGARRLGLHELMQASNLRQFYGEQIGAPPDIARFFREDNYGRSILEQSRSASSDALAELSKHHMGEDGGPQLHRRNARRPISLRLAIRALPQSKSESMHSGVVTAMFDT